MQRMSKKTEMEIVEKMCQELSKQGYEVVSRYGKWNSKTKGWENNES